MSSFENDTLKRILNNESSLTTLSMRLHSDDEAEALGDALSRNNKLHTLIFSYCDLSGIRMDLLFPYMPANIERLSLCNCDIGIDSVKALASILEHSNINHLDLRHNPLGDEGARILSQVMTRRNCAWESLFLGNCGIGNKGATSLAQGMTQLHGSLRNLDLRGNSIGSRGCLALSRALALDVTELETLDLRDNRIGDDGADSLSLVIMYYQSSSKLTDVNLSGNRIGDEGAGKIAHALTYNTTIRRLRLSGNSIGDEGAEELLSAMDYNGTLVHVDLSHNQACKEIRQDIARVLEENRKGKRRNVNRKALPDTTTMCFSQGCHEYSSLKKQSPFKSPWKETNSGFIAILKHAIACG